MQLHGPSQALRWEELRGDILNILVTQGKSLAEVRDYMKDKHDFDVTQVYALWVQSHQIPQLTTSPWYSERQYKYKFPRLKTVRANEWDG